MKETAEMKFTKQDIKSLTNNIKKCDMKEFTKQYIESLPNNMREDYQAT